MSDAEPDDIEASGNVGDNSSIEVYGRIRPHNKNDHSLFEVQNDNKMIELRFPRDQTTANYVNNKKEVYNFKLNHIFHEKTTQEEIFENIGRKVVNNVLAGFNGTIFAYGQTGSGKTFTITGGDSRYEDRGLIPRTLAAIFEEKEKRTDLQFSVSISYLEIYNDDGYDLLDAEHETKSLSELPKVAMFEDEMGNIHMRNIHVLPANTVDEALNLLFVGDTNRIICETPSNDASSRSHCIFTIYLEAREVGGSKIRRSKLHLVDLAGSERVKKTQIVGQMLKEALHINLALHYLEQVIVALHKRTKDKNVHIPYRNSMMTSVLRDSLGGNCKTVMIATMSGQRDHIDESISTCRFAQRVALVKNTAFINEEVDPQMIIKRLKLQVKELREELALLKGDGRVSLQKELDDDERERCAMIVREFLDNSAHNEKADFTISLPNPSKVKACFDIFKQMIQDAASKGGGGGGSNNQGNNNNLPASPTKYGRGGASQSGGASGNESEEVKRLRMLLAARDNEITILVSMLKKNENQPHHPALTAGNSLSASLTGGNGPSSNNVGGGGGGAPVLLEKSVAALEQLHASLPSSKALLTVEEDAMLLARRTAAFDEFRKSYRKNQMIEEQKDTLREKISKAQYLGESINKSRTAINELKALIEQKRIQRGVQQLTSNGSGEGGSEEEDSEEQRLKSSIETEKKAYRDNFNLLKDMKAEIEHLKALIERSRRKLQSDFEVWYKQQFPEEEAQKKKLIQEAVANNLAANNTNTNNYPTATTTIHNHSTMNNFPPIYSRDLDGTGSANNSSRGSGRFALASSLSLSASAAAASNSAPSPSAASTSNSTNNYSFRQSAAQFAANDSTQGPSGSIMPSSSSSSSSSSSASSVTSSNSSSLRQGAAAIASGGGSGVSLPRLASTGNAQADADIARFYEVRDQLLRQQQQQQQQQKRT